MTSYFSNSYIPDHLRTNGTPDHYSQQSSCSGPGGGVNGGGVGPDPSSLHHYPHPQQHHHPHQGQGGVVNGQGQGQPLYPRFPPYDRLHPGYYGDSGGYRPPSPPPSVNNGVPMGVGPGVGPPHGVVPMQQQQQQVPHPPLTPSGYNSCKMVGGGAPHPQVSPGVGKWEPVGPPLSPELGGMGGGGHMNGSMTPNGGGHNQQHMMYNNGGGGMGGGMGGHGGGGGGVHAGGANGGGVPHPNQNIQNPHQSPQQQNSPAAALPSPLYPWMRSQFGKGYTHLLSS